MNKIKVSIVVPVFNVEEYLKRCLDSLLNQTMKEIQIILVDDGSQDNSGKICDEYVQTYENIEVIHQENHGLTYARRVGLERCKGEYVTFVDSDDWVDDTMCENMYRYAEDSGAKIVICDFNIVNGQEVLYKEGYFANEVKIENYYTTLTPNYVWNKLYHSSLLDKMKVNISVSQAEDVCLLLPLVSKLEKDSDLAYLKEAHYYYFQRAYSSSRSDFFVESYGIEEYLQSMKYILEHCDERHQKYVVFYCVQCLYWGINNPDRVFFKANYIDFLKKEVYPYIMGNQLLKRFSNLMDALLTETIPSTLVFGNFFAENFTESQLACMESWQKYCKDYQFVCLNEENCSIEDAPACVKFAYQKHRKEFVTDYFKVKYLYDFGGIAINTNIRITKPLGEQRMHRVFLGYINEHQLGCDIWGGVQHDKLMMKVLNTYEEDSIFNDAFLSLADRIQMVLEREYKFIPKGRECYLMTNLVKIYTRETLYNRLNSKNVSRYFDELDIQAQMRNKVLIDEADYTELLKEFTKKVQTVPAKSIQLASTNKEENLEKIKELEKEVCELNSQVNELTANLNTQKKAYDLVIQSTCWKITSPLRKMLDLFKKND